MSEQNNSRPDEPVQINAEEARQAERNVGMRWVLIVSGVAAVLALGIVGVSYSG